MYRPTYSARIRRPGIRAAVLPLLAALLLVAGLGGGFAAAHAGAAPARAAATVAIQNFAFDPPDLTIQVGDSVTWTNMDTAPHTATSRTGGIFDSGTLNKGQSFTFTFNTAGDFEYYCRFHANMVAHLHVIAAAQATSTVALQATSTAAPQATATTPAQATVAPAATSTTAALPPPAMPEATQPMPMPTAMPVETPTGGNSGGNTGGTGAPGMPTTGAGEGPWGLLVLAGLGLAVVALGGALRRGTQPR